MQTNQLHQTTPSHGGDLPGSVQDASGYTIFSSGDVGAAHAMAHRMLDEGKIELGHRLLGEWLSDRSGSGSEWVHIQFHMAIFELELGLTQAAYSRFVEHVLPAAAGTTEALTDAPALAWRLWLATGSPTLFPWEPIRSTAAARLDEHDDPWVDLHNALALAGARDHSGLTRWIGSRKRRARTPEDGLVIEMVEALRAFALGHDVEASNRLAATVPRIAEVGGSRAQNQLFEQIEKAVRRRMSLQMIARPTAEAA